MSRQDNTPATGIRGLKLYWRSDLVASVSVALVTLPLSLGIALASGVDPMAGIWAAIVGGVVTTFIRGSHIAINGPGAGLIAVVLSGVIALNDGSGQSLNYVFAAITISGAIQVLLGFLKVGRLASLFPSSVIHGVLAAIGVIIFANQMHVALGTTTDATDTIGVLSDLIYQLPNVNPYVATISVFGLLLLVFSSKINYKLFRFIPAPMWVLLLSIPFAYLLNLTNVHTSGLIGKDYHLGPDFFLAIPDDILDSIAFPDYSMIGNRAFWLTVLSITAISSIETLAIGRAIDRMDPYKRATDLNKELIAIGFGTMVSGGIGGLPIIPEIVRSTVNVHNQAITKWSNLFQGIILALFIFLLAPLLGNVPLAALAAILVHTGYKLASPKVFKHAYDQGVEQLLFLLSTIGITLFTNLLYGIIGGMLVALVLHMLLAKVGIRRFFKLAFNSGSRIQHKNSNSLDVKLKGVANFLSSISLNELLKKIPEGAIVNVDMSQARLVDLSIMETVIEFKRTHEIAGGQVSIVGLQNHVSSNSHNRALKIITGPPKVKFTKRQIRLQRMANQFGWTFNRDVDWNTSYLRNFEFFKTRPIEKKNNSIKGFDEVHGVHWEIADIRFDEGAWHSSDVFHTTVHVVHLPDTIPEFTIEKEGMFDKMIDGVRSFSGHKDIDFHKHPRFSSRFLLLSNDEPGVRAFFDDSLIDFFVNNEAHHIESNGQALLIFKGLRLTRTDEIDSMLGYSDQLLKAIQARS